MYLSVTSAPRSRGFTLIELMVVISITAILLLIAVPSFQQWIANSKARTAAEALQNALRLAQTTAMAQGSQTILVLTNTATLGVSEAPAAAGAAASYWYVQTTPNALSLANGQGSILVDTAPAGSIQGVTVTAAPLLAGGVPVNAVCFNSLGRQVAASTANIPPDNIPAGSQCLAQATQFNIKPPVPGNRPLAVQVSAGGTVRSCDPNFTQAQQPFGC